MTGAQAVAVPFELRALLADMAAAQVADDQRWILTLMRKQGPPVMALLWRMLGSEADVLDAYQTAVCNLTALGTGRIASNHAGYFYRTAMNAAIEILRSRKRRRQHWPAVVEAHRRRESALAPASGGVYQREASERLRSAICRLPRQLQSVVILRDLAELPYRRVAKILGIQVSTARLYRRQAVVRLADLIGEEVG